MANQLPEPQAAVFDENERFTVPWYLFFRFLNSGSGGIIPAPGNPTAVAGPLAINGVATTYMRSDAAPAVQVGSAVQLGLLQVDGTTITAAAGVISAAVPSGANPSATAGPATINGVAATFMRSDAAPAVQIGSAVQKGLVQVDGTTITAAAGVISAALPVGANPSATAGPAAINGTAPTFMRSDAAPAIQLGSAVQKGLVQVDGTTITASGGVISAVVPVGANPSATAGPAAINGSAATFMRSDGAPAVQVGTSGQKGILQVDGTTIRAAAGVITGYPWRGLQVLVTDPLGAALAVIAGILYVRINSRLNGYNLVAVASSVYTASTVGLPTVQLTRLRGGVSAAMLSTQLSIDALELDSSTAATPAVINAANAGVQTADQIRIDVTVAGAGATGLIVDLIFEAP